MRQNPAAPRTETSAQRYSGTGDLWLALTTKEKVLLRAAAEFRLATASHLSEWLATSEQMVRRRARTLVGRGLLKTTSRGFGRRGRPESVLSLTEQGVEELRVQGVVGRDLPPDRVTGDALGKTVEHQLLLNRIAVECAHLERRSNGFATKFISSTSPHYLSAAGGTILHDHVVAADGTEITFAPDAALCITRREDGKSLLFFVEIDMGTEPLTRQRGERGSEIRRKIAVYRVYLGKKGYRRYGGRGMFGVALNGFRLLVVAHSFERCNEVARLVRSTAPSDFVWLCDQGSLLEQGLNGDIWAVGGRSDEGARCILKRKE